MWLALIQAVKYCRSVERKEAVVACFTLVNFWFIEFSLRFQRLFLPSRLNDLMIHHRSQSQAKFSKVIKPRNFHAAFVLIFISQIITRRVLQLETFFNERILLRDCCKSVKHSTANYNLLKYRYNFFEWNTSSDENLHLNSSSSRFSSPLI